MKRRAIQLANNTLVVSLPAKWVQSNGIKKGANLDVSVKERMLIIRKDYDSGPEAKDVRIDISGMNASLVWNFLNAVYRAGFSEIEVFFPDQELNDIKTGKKSRTMDVISRVTDKLIGVEIIRQSRNSCVLKEITSLKGEEYHNIINRIFLSLGTISNDILEAVRKNDAETLENIHRYSEVNINKLSDYCMRALNIQGLGDFKESNSNYLMTFLLEEVGDAYADIARCLSSSGKKRISDDALNVFEQINELVSLSYKFFLNPKKEYYISFHEQRNRIKKRIDSLVDSRKDVDVEIIIYLRSILDRLMEVNNAKVTVIDGFSRNPL